MKISIPEISDAELADLISKIRPTVRQPHNPSGKLFFVSPGNPRNESYLWNSEFLETAADLIEVENIRTYHTYGYYGFFKPSVAEVIAQIPMELRSVVCAFEIVKNPERAEDLNDEHEALNQGFHVATTRLYRKS